MDGLFNRCPSCGSFHISFGSYANKTQEHCMECGFTTNWVEFTCKCCNPDTVGICPRKACANPGKPTEKLCIPKDI